MSSITVAVIIVLILLVIWYSQGYDKHETYVLMPNNAAIYTNVPLVYQYEMDTEHFDPTFIPGPPVQRKANMDYVQPVRIYPDPNMPNRQTPFPIQRSDQNFQ